MQNTKKIVTYLLVAVLIIGAAIGLSLWSKAISFKLKDQKQPVTKIELISLDGATETVISEIAGTDKVRLSSCLAALGDVVYLRKSGAGAVKPQQDGFIRITYEDGSHIRLNDDYIRYFDAAGKLTKETYGTAKKGALIKIVDQYLPKFAPETPPTA